MYGTGNKKMINKILFVGILCIITSVVHSANQNKLKPVTTFLNAKWMEPPLLFEALEYLSDENDAAVWAFIEAINNINLIEFTAKNEEQKFDIVLSIANNFLTDSQISLMKFSLSLHVYSPKIEAFHKIAIDRGITALSNCDAAIDLGSEIICNVKDLEMALEKPIVSTHNIFEIDHKYPGGDESKVTAILYGEPGTSSFKTFHEALKSLAELNKLKYIFRPLTKKSSRRKLRLSGYGVELQIKSTEYKAQDDTKVTEEGNINIEDDVEKELEGFIFSTLNGLYPNDSDKLVKLKQHLLEASDEMAPMKVWQLQHLSMQAAQRIMTSPADEMLNVFTNTAQNFPALARSLTRTKVDDKLRREILKNQDDIRLNSEINPTDAAIFINGMYFDLDTTDIYTLLDHIKNEQRVMQGLHKLGIEGETLKNLLKLDTSEMKTEYGIDIRDSAIVWMNDIEKDKAYKNWPSNIGELLRPTYPGMLRSIRKNLHNLVIVADPIQSESIGLIKMVEIFLSHTSPLRFGLVLSVTPDRKVSGVEDPRVALLCSFNYVIQSYDDSEDSNYKGLKYLTDFYEHTDGSDITAESVKEYFKVRYPSEDLDDVFGSDSDFDVGRQLSNMFIDKGGFNSFPQALMNGVQLPSKQLAADEFEEMALMEVMKNTQIVQRAVYKGELDDSKDVIDYFMAMPNIMPRLNDRILSSKSSEYLDLSGGTPPISTLNDMTEEAFGALSANEMSAVIGDSCRYMSYKSDSVLRPLTVWIVADYETDQGRALLREAVKYTRESNGIRVCALNNAMDRGAMSEAIEIAQNTLSPPTVRQFLAKILEPENWRKITKKEKKISDFSITGMDMEAFNSRLSNFDKKIFNLHSIYVNRVLGLPIGKATVVANGRVLGMFRPNETFSEEDLALLERFFSSSVGNKITETLKVDESDPISSDLFMKISGVMQSKSQSKSRLDLQLNSEQFSVIKMPAKDGNLPSFDLLAICDPVSEAAQKIGPIVQILYNVLNANVRIVLNAVEKHSEMPLKSFYRYVLQTAPEFSESGDVLAGPHARFSGLPESPILTQNYHVPENWLVEVVKSIYDLDNIKMEQVESGVHSEFELENLLLEGHCFDQSTGTPPRGLQFTLGTQQNPIMVDTIVMANLGYFQLKANPGAMILRLREGRSSDIYNIVSHEGTSTPAGSDGDVMAVLHSFRSHLVKLKVSKKAGQQDEDLLADEDEESGGLWDSISSTFSKATSDDSADERINIFSVASGHLYERFLRIMMVSARKHSTKPVKFWFIKNFLSPNIKDSLPALAKKFDFEYELVQYKWPRWLHQQTEKQRIIWGYKILFLDVLFPLDVKKIIFVDADQVVRADLKDLVDLDLEGAPYGFVPFCDSRKEMDGFRFWKQGYWRNHLAGRKYHISALFVVDLKKFRRIAAGDRLRGQYQGLSQDPNSLSNLDQDLPNNMVHQVRIKSLPMEWLWCETWCDDYSKASAKVIDLCNNPLTKEAKLVAADRIISEWAGYDTAIKSVLDSSSNGSNNQSKDEKVEDKHTEL